jgi:hypothetical protein
MTILQKEICYVKSRLYFKHLHFAFNILHVQFVKPIKVKFKVLGLGLLERLILE